MSEAEATVREPKVIKRYTNRKLYDTVESRYVTLDEIAEMVKQGVEVKIVDNRTKEDLTSVTLAQIVFEEEKKKNQLSLSVLREIIRRPGESLGTFITTQVSPRVESLRHETAQRLGQILGRDSTKEPVKEAPPLKDAKETEHDAGALLQQSQKVLESWQARIDERVKTVLEGVLGNLPALGRDLNTLVQRIEQLEKKIDSLEDKKK